MRVKVPGQLSQKTERPWHEQIDDQWQEYYARRPPSVNEQLHGIINEVEKAAITAATNIPRVPAPLIPKKPTLDLKVISKHRKTARRAAVKGMSILARSQRREALTKAQAMHDQWSRDQATALNISYRNVCDLIEKAHTAWKGGDVAATYVVANALLSATGAHGSLASLSGSTATLLVFAPPLDEVHPCKPTYSKGGAPTVHKRTNAERLVAHRTLIGANATSALNSLRSAAPQLRNVDVVVLSTASSNAELADCSVIATFTSNLGSLPSSAGEFERMIALHAPSKPLTLRSAIPDLWHGEQGNPAIATFCDSVNDLAQPDFWLEVSSALNALGST